MVFTLERSGKVESQSVRQQGEPPETVQEAIEEGLQFKNEILILISAPLLKEDNSPIEDLSIQKEVDEIVSILESLPQQITLEVTVKIATTESLLEVFSKKLKPLIIHFIGHGMSRDEGCALLLESAVGLARPFTEDELHRLLANRTTPPCKLALLNACHSQELANELVGAGVSHVIAVNAEDTVLDLTACVFSRHLYQALFNQWNVIEAFEHSRSAVLINDELAQLFNEKTFEKGVNLEEAFKFQLLPRNSSVHHAPLGFQSVSVGNIIAPNWENTNIPSNDLTFVGRRMDIHYLANDLINQQHRCIALHGMGGMGKTALALAVGRWQHERRRWRDGVWFIRLRDVNLGIKASTQILETLAINGVIASGSAALSALKDKKSLLILDDLDQLIEQDPEGLKDLLNTLLSCRSLKMLITSRVDLPAQIYHQRREVQGLERTDSMKAFWNYNPPTYAWNQQDFEALLEFLGGYPFPICLAANYMRETRCSLKVLCQKLQISPLKTLKPRVERESRENSLRATLELSYNALPQGAKQMFPLLAFFPGGLSEELATFVWKEASFEDLSVLLQFSMAEMPKTNHDNWRVNLPEPARRYAESKQVQEVKDFAPKVLEYYYDFSQRIVDLFFQEQESKVGKELLLQESSNLSYFLQWGYESEIANNSFCYCARITALLCKYWAWITPREDLVHRLENALEAAKRNGDILGQADVVRSLADFQLLSEGLEVARVGYQESILLYSDACKKADNRIDVANILMKIGEVHRACQEINLALASCLEACDIYLEEGSTLKAAHAKIVLGQLEESIEKFEKALENYEEAKRLYISQEYGLGVSKANTLIENLRFSLQNIELKSARGITYYRLRDLLAESRWQEADQETNRLICQAAGREEDRWLGIEDIEKFPRDDLQTINRLWLYYSNGKFGFSVQKQTWLASGGIPNNFSGDAYVEYCDRVGWRENGNCVKYKNLIFELKNAPKGHLPVATSIRWDRDPTRARIRGYTFFSRSDL